MNSIQLTPEERVRALQRFGYTEREAAFLCLAALQGGYFLRRQFDRFLNQKDGGTTAQLIEKALALQHVQVFTYHHKVGIHHLCSRPFYEAIGQADNRNRRKREPLTIKNKLMGLDFVLEHSGGRYLATEQEKLDHFTGTLQIPLSALPAKLYHAASGPDRTARYFVDKYPIFLSNSLVPARPQMVVFSYVDEGTKTVSRFETYLAQYRQLLATLPEFGIIYVAATPALFASAQSTFERCGRQWQSARNGSAWDPEIRRMLEHFEARRLYETGQLSGFDRAKLVRFRNDREEFSGTDHDTLYARWKIRGERAFAPAVAPQTTVPVVRGAFSTYLLEHRYDFFGNLTGF